MKLDFATYKDKVMGCWAGKNIGGVLGAPFEGRRQVNDISFYTQDLSMGPPPNDDLDLQIIWLAAVERYGRNVNASILGEYWLSYCIPNWVEYGTGKANLRAGLQPPLSGLIDNTYKDSCGCYIRSEIWACLAPAIRIWRHAMPTRMPLSIMKAKACMVKFSSRLCRAPPLWKATNGP